MLISVVLHSTAIGCVTLACILLTRYLRWFFSPLRKIPGPKHRGSIFGNFPQIRKEEFMQPHKSWWKDAGIDARAIHYTLPFWRPCLVVLDKGIIRTILTAQYGKDKVRFYKVIRMLSDILGDGLVTLQGEDWMRHRRMLHPSFNTNFLREALNEAVPPKVNRFVQCWERASAESAEDREIDLNSHLSSLTLDIIGDVAFSHSFKALDAVEQWSRLATNRQHANVDGDNKPDDELAKITDPFITYLHKAIKINLISSILSLSGLASLSRYVNPHVRRNRYFLDQAVDRVVADARKENTKTTSILHLLLHAKDPEQKGDQSKATLSDTELRDEVKTFIIAGHETTSTWLYWALYALSIYPEVQNRVHENVVKHAPSTVPEILMEHVDKMDYMNAFLLEVLRMYPPVGFFTRVNSEEEDFGNGLIVPAGTRIAICPHLMHRHPKYWDDPEDFKPERWLNETEEEAERRRFAFIPFSAGGRGCIGQQFATMEAKLILASLVRAFRVAIASSQRMTEFKLTTSITAKTKPLLKICVKKR